MIHASVKSSPLPASGERDRKRGLDVRAENCKFKTKIYGSVRSFPSLTKGRAREGIYLMVIFLFYGNQG
jgi:hypothetical protein